MGGGERKVAATGKGRSIMHLARETAMAPFGRRKQEVLKVDSVVRNLGKDGEEALTKNGDRVHMGKTHQKKKTTGPIMGGRF